MKKFITTSALARMLNIANATLNRRIHSGQILPDAYLVQGQRRAEGLLFDLERLPQIRQAMHADAVTGINTNAA